MWHTYEMNLTQEDFSFNIIRLTINVCNKIDEICESIYLSNKKHEICDPNSHKQTSFHIIIILNST